MYNYMPEFDLALLDSVIENPSLLPEPDEACWIAYDKTLAASTLIAMLSRGSIVPGLKGDPSHRPPSDSGMSFPYCEVEGIKVSIAPTQKRYKPRRQTSNSKNGQLKSILKKPRPLPDSLSKAMDSRKYVASRKFIKFALDS